MEFSGSEQIVDGHRFRVGGSHPDSRVPARDNIVGSLAWEDGFPQGGFAVERPRAHIWNNYPLKSTDIPMVDGDPETSTEDRFKVFGASQTGRQFYLDLGSRFPLNRMTFFPRLTGLSPTGDPFSDDFIRGYEIHFNDGLLLGEDRRPIYSLLKRVDLTRDSVAVVEFPLQFVRHLRLGVIQPNPFEIAEIQLFGSGFVPRAGYLSNVIDFGRPVNFGRLGWNATRLRLLNEEIIVEDGAAASAFLQMKSGSDDSPLIHYEITNKFFGETAEVSESDYNSLAPDDRGGIEDDQINWSPWSEPFTESGKLIALPSPRQYFQFRVVMESRSILDGIRLDSLAVEISSPPLANSLIGEISLLDEPQPEERFAVVPAGESCHLCLRHPRRRQRRSDRFRRPDDFHPIHCILPGIPDGGGRSLSGPGDSGEGNLHRAGADSGVPRQPGVFRNRHEGGVRRPGPYSGYFLRCRRVRFPERGADPAGVAVECHRPRQYRQIAGSYFGRHAPGRVELTRNCPQDPYPQRRRGQRRRGDRFSDPSGARGRAHPDRGVRPFRPAGPDPGGHTVRARLCTQRPGTAPTPTARSYR